MADVQRVRADGRFDVSVVIPLFDKAPTVKRAVLSACRQTHPPFEIIVVDDGSTDGGADLVAAGFPEVIIVRQENQGEGPARNAGVARARGEWVAFLDADDVWGAHHLQELALATASHPTCEFASTRAGRRIDEDRLPDDAEHAIVIADRLLGRSAEPSRSVPSRASLVDYLTAAAGRSSPINASTVTVRRLRLAEGGIRFPHDGLHADLAVWCQLAVDDPLLLVPVRTVVTTRSASSVTERHRAASIRNPERDCAAYRFRADHRVVERALSSGALVGARAEAAERYLDGIVTRHWPTVLLYADQHCARVASRTLHARWSIPAVLFRLASTLPVGVARPLAWLLRRLAIAAGLTLPVSPFAARSG